MENCSRSIAARYPATGICFFVPETHDVRNLTRDIDVTQCDTSDTLPASKHWLPLAKWIPTWQTKAIGELSSDLPVTASLVSELASLVLLVVFLVCIKTTQSGQVY